MEHLYNRSKNFTNYDYKPCGNFISFTIIRNEIHTWLSRQGLGYVLTVVITRPIRELIQQLTSYQSITYGSRIKAPQAKSPRTKAPRTKAPEIKAITSFEY